MELFHEQRLRHSFSIALNDKVLGRGAAKVGYPCAIQQRSGDDVTPGCWAVTL